MTLRPRSSALLAYSSSPYLGMWITGWRDGVAKLERGRRRWSGGNDAASPGVTAPFPIPYSITTGAPGLSPAPPDEDAAEEHAKRNDQHRGQEDPARRGVHERDGVALGLLRRDVDQGFLFGQPVDRVHEEHRIAQVHGLKAALVANAEFPTTTSRVLFFLSSVWLGESVICSFLSHYRQARLGRADRPRPAGMALPAWSRPRPCSASSRARGP